MTKITTYDEAAQEALISSKDKIDNDFDLLIERFNDEIKIEARRIHTGIQYPSPKSMHINLSLKGIYYYGFNEKRFQLAIVESGWIITSVNIIKDGRGDNTAHYKIEAMGESK